MKLKAGLNVTEPSAFSTTLPPVPFETEAMRSGEPSTSESLPSRSAAAKVAAVSSMADSTSGNPTGTSFTGATFTTTPVLALRAVPSLAT